MKKNQEEYLWLLIIIAMGFFLRFFHFADFSLSNDELSAINRLNYPDFLSMIQNGVRPDGHPALAQTLLYFWTHLFGLSDFSIRFPFVFISSLAPLFIYLGTKKLFGSTPALFSAAAIAFLDFPVLYGQIARPYGIGLTFIAFAFYCLWLTLDNRKPNKWSFIALGIAWALCAYTHYFTAMAAVLLGVLGLFFLKKSRVLAYMASILIAIVLFLPHLQISLHQIGLGGIGQWLGKPQPTWIFGYIYYIFNQHFYILLGFPIIAIYLYNRYPSKRNQNLILGFLGLFILNFLIGYLYSIYVNPVLQYSVLLFSLPFLMLFVFGLINPQFTHRAKITLMLFSFLLVLDHLFISHYPQKQHFAAFKESVQQAEKWQAEYNDNIIHLANTNSLNYLKHYNTDSANFPQFGMSQIKTSLDLLHLEDLLRNSPQEFAAFYDLQNNSNYLTKSIIENYYPSILQDSNFQNKTTYYLFSKSKASSTSTGIPLLKKTKLDSTQKEFFWGFKGLFPKDIESKSIQIKGKIYFHGGKIEHSSHWVVSIENQENKVILWKSLPFKYFHAPFATMDFSIPYQKDFHVFKSYIWNPGKKMLRIDSLKLETNLQMKPIP